MQIHFLEWKSKYVLAKKLPPEADVLNLHVIGFVVELDLSKS